MKGKVNFFRIAITLIVALALAGVIAFIVYYTNNFSTDLTTFYVQYGAQELRRDIDGMQFEKGTYYTFRCDYPLGFPSSEKGERFKVSVEANEAGQEIGYKVDSRPTKFYPKSPDVGASFEIAKSENTFTFRIPEETTLESILTRAYEGKEVTEIPEVDFAAKDYFSLVVKSYDESVIIKIGFGFKVEENGEENNDGGEEENES